jgi:hypothetical protein
VCCPAAAGFAVGQPFCVVVILYLVSGILKRLECIIMSVKKNIFCVAFLGCLLFQYFLPVNSVAVELSAKQKVLADRYAQLEQALSRMSMATAKTDPKRAALLEKVLLMSKEKLVGDRLENIVALLESKRLGDSALGQKEVEKDISELLQLLESDDKKDANTLKREQLQRLIKELTDLYNQQRINAQRAASQDKDNLESVTQEQEKIRRKTEELRKSLDEHEGRNNNDSDKSDNDSNPENSNKNKSDDAKNDQPKDSDNNKAGESKNDQPKNSDKNESGESKKGQSDGQSGESGSDEENKENKENQNDNDDNSAEDSPQRDLKKANKHQQQAKNNLQEKKKNEAHAEMDAAAAEIIRAKEKLMKMLRQLREEELMQTLEKLNARFKRMLQIEQAVRGQTEELGNELKLIGADSGEMRQIKVRASKLAGDQGVVMDDTDTALILLREDGTAQAMLESLLQVRFDIGDAKARLERTEADAVTLEIEDAVISALREMIEAVEEAIEESKERQEEMKKQQQNQKQQNGEKEEPLIQLLAELKMIRSMQTRVNERTSRYEKLTAKKLQEDPKSDLGPISKSVEELARQQNRISRILHDIKVGKTEKK